MVLFSTKELNPGQWSYTAYFTYKKLKSLNTAELNQDKRTTSIGYPVKLEDTCITTMVLGLLAGTIFLADTPITGPHLTIPIPYLLHLQQLQHLQHNLIQPMQQVAKRSSICPLPPFTSAQDTLSARRSSFVVFPKCTPKASPQKGRGIKGRNQLGIKEELPYIQTQYQMGGDQGHQRAQREPF